jgi:mannosyltransferase
LLAISLVVRLRCLTQKPFWFDEAFSVEVARIDWRNFLHLLWWREANMSLYYVLLRIWLHLGQSPFFIRSLSVLIAVATVPAVYWLARLLYDRQVALIAAALFALNAFHVRYAQEARSYGLFVLLATLSSGSLISSLQQSSPSKLRAYVITSVLAVYAHLYALLLIVSHWIASRRLQERADGPTFSAQMRRAWIAIGIAVLPLLIFVAKTGAGPIRWIQRPRIVDLLQFFEHLTGGNSWPLPVMYAVACLVVIASVGTPLWTHHPNWNAWRVQFLLVWLLFPVALTVLLSFARPVFLGRYLIFCLPALAILAAAGLARLRQPWVLATALAMMLFFSLRGISFVYANDFDEERDTSGAATDFILDHAGPGDAIIFHIAETRVPYEFFRSLRAGESTSSPNFTGQLGPEILFPRHDAGLGYRDFTGKPTADFVRAATRGHARVWVMLMHNGPVGKPDPTTLMLAQVMPESFPRSTSWQFVKVEVRLYSRE